jgi:RNA polymerase sigma-70 factor (family 1)
MGDKDTYNKLFDEIRDNNVEAYRTLYAQFYASLCVYALRYVQDKHVAEDCVQEVFLKIWKDRNLINITSSVRSYLLVSVRNTCLNLIEKQKLEFTYEQHILATYDPFEEDDLYSIEELTNLIEEAINKLPEKYQQVFRMSRFDNLKNKEIAERLNISIKTVEAYMTKSLKMLNVEVGKYYSILLLLYFMKEI